jgi:DNA-directed RNA polymerase specialized sigma24 family protein
MGSQQLQNFIDNCSPNEKRRWVRERIAAAEGLRNRLRQRMGAPRVVNGLPALPSELPEADEIVSETLIRICEDRKGYVWDGTGTLDDFFYSSMIKTMEGLRSGERKHRVAARKFVPNTDVYTGAPLVTDHEQNWKTDDDIAKRDFKRTLATAIVDPSRWGALRVYVGRLPQYATSKSTAKEIADDLGVKPGSINPFRMRVRHTLTKKE